MTVFWTEITGDAYPPARSRALASSMGTPRSRTDAGEGIGGEIGGEIGKRRSIQCRRLDCMQIRISKEIGEAIGVDVLDRPGPAPDATPLKREASYMRQEVLLRGEVARGDVLGVSGMAERTGRDVLAQLLQEGLLVSDSPKGRVRLGIPTAVAAVLFPDLYPAHVLG